ncbi:MAG: putative two-component sensor [Pseudonocardiales bacterium]|nr:putative two-component sensor [Pseudonocardiales bacterium]
MSSARRSRIQTWVSGHPILLDYALVVLLDAWALGSMLHQQERPLWWPILISQLLVLPLAVRRRWPWTVFAVVASVGAVQWLTDVPLAADAALVVALYTVAAFCPRRRALIAAGVIEIGVVLASVRFAPTGDGVVASLVLLSGMVAAALFSGMTLRTRRQYLAALTERAIRLERERDQQAQLAATAERSRIARELHDVIAHSLSVMITLADAAVLVNETDSAQAREAMSQVAATGRVSMAEMRRLLGVLREDASGTAELAPQPGLDRMESLVGEVRATGLPVELVTTGTPRSLPLTEQSAVYRIVQEGLTNALKHADDPSLVRVEISWSTTALGIDIVDNGRDRGKSASRGAGHGLVGMRERAGLFNGTVESGPTSIGGWRVHATFPLAVQA